MKGMIRLKPLFKEEIKVERKIEDAWHFFVQFRNAEKWMPEVSEIHTPLDALPLRVGSILEMTLNGNRQRLEIKKFEPAKVIVLQSVIGHFTIEHVYHFNAIAENTSVNLEVRTEAYGIVTKLISIMIRKMIKKRDEGQLQIFKEVIEKEAV